MDIYEEKRNARSETYKQNVFVHHSITTEFLMERPHFHDGYEIHLTMTDNTMFYFSDKAYCLKKGSLTFVSNNEIHRVLPPKDYVYERYVVSFMPHYISDLNIANDDLFEFFINRPKGFVHSILLTDEQLQQFFTQFEFLQQSMVMKTKYASELRKKLSITQFVLMCNEFFSQHRLDNCYTNMQTAERVKKVVSYIKHNLGEDLSLDRLCSEFSMSKSHFIRVFKEGTGATPTEYIIMMRIMKSLEYLKSGYSIIDVCGLVGYEDESNFIRTFKKITGMTPKQYGKHLSDLEKKNTSNICILLK